MNKNETKTNNPTSSQHWLLIRSLFKSKWAGGWICAQVLQQLIVASSSIWIVNLIRNVESGESFWLSLSLFFASLLIPYITGAGTMMCLANWYQTSIHYFVDRFIHTHSGNISLWQDKPSRRRIMPIISTEANESIRKFCDYSYDLLSSLLNVIFNITVLAVIISPVYLIGYGISIVVVTVLLYIQKHRQHQLAAYAQQGRISLGDSLLNIWDNILLGNVYNAKKWRSHFETQFQHARSTNVSNEVFQQMISIAIALASMIPCMVIVYGSMSQHSLSQSDLAAFVVTLPRLFMILNFTYQVLAHLSRWPDQRERLAGLAAGFDQGQHIPLTDRITWGKIQLHTSQTTLSCSSVETLLQHLTETGRFTIRGENGSGKSTLLMAIKAALGHRAAYLPAKHHLHFDANQHGQSSGQTLKAELSELITNSTADVLLLDEWDANLDNDRIADLTALINKAALSRCIIEVRHRVDG